MQDDDQVIPEREGPDWGLVAVLVLLVAIPVGIWRLYVSLSAAESTPAPVEVPATDESEAEPAPRRRLRRGEREAEIERLGRLLDDAETELRHLRMEQARSPGASWAEALADKQAEIADLQRQLEALRR